MGFTLYRSQSEENCCLNQVKTGCFGSKPMTPIIKSISIKKQVPNKNTHQNQFKIKRGYLLGQPLKAFIRKTILSLDYQVEALTGLSQGAFCLMNPDFAADYSLRPGSSCTESNLKPVSFPWLIQVDLDLG